VPIARPVKQILLKVAQWLDQASKCSNKVWTPSFVVTHPRSRTGSKVVRCL